MNPLNATQRSIDHNGGASHEVITFQNAAAVDASDYVLE